MHRKGMNPDNVQPEDILCDYCAVPAWSENIPCIEGHQGSVICGNCLSIAFNYAINHKDRIITDQQCRMCLEHRDDNGWEGKIDPVAIICVRCIRQASGALHKSKHWDWTKPSKE